MTLFVSLPGLSALNLIAVQPPVGIPTVFLSGGSTKLNFAGSFTGSKLPTPLPMTKKLYEKDVTRQLEDLYLESPTQSSS